MLHDQKLDVPMIVKYRKFEYASELDEKAVWAIFNLDQEYGKLMKHKAQIAEFLAKVVTLNRDLKIYEDQLLYAKTRSDINNFNALIRFLKSYYHKELVQDEIVKGKK